MIDGIDSNYKKIFPIKVPAIKRVEQAPRDRNRKFGSNHNSSDDKKAKLLSKIYGKTGQIEALQSNDNHFIDFNA